MKTLGQTLKEIQERHKNLHEQLEKAEKLIVQLESRISALEDPPTATERSLWDRRGEKRVEAVRSYRQRTGKTVHDSVRAFCPGGKMD